MNELHSAIAHMLACFPKILPDSFAVWFGLVDPLRQLDDEPLPLNLIAAVFLYVFIYVHFTVTLSTPKLRLNI